MCLDIKFFKEAGKRKKHRDQHGMTVEEIISHLNCFETTVYPIAVEVAHWIYQNWPLAKIYSLPNETQSI